MQPHKLGSGGGGCTSRHIQHSPGTPTTGLRERGNDTSRSTGRSGRQNAATRRNMRREERVTVRGPVRKQQPDGMSHMGTCGAATPRPALALRDACFATPAPCACVRLISEGSPTAVADESRTNANTPVVVDVLANDSDPDGDTLSVASYTQPSHGAASLNADGTITYTPNAGYTGSDTFAYTIGDGTGGTAMAAVRITGARGDVCGRT